MYKQTIVSFGFLYIYLGITTMLKRNAKTPGQPANKVRKVFRFTMEVQNRLRLAATREGVTMAFYLDHLINEHWDNESQISGYTLEDIENSYDGGWRTNSCQVFNQKRYPRQFRMDAETVRILKALSQWQRETQTRVCEELINHDYARKIYK